MNTYEIEEYYNTTKVYIVRAESREHAMKLHNDNKSKLIVVDTSDVYDYEVTEAEL